MKIVKVAKKLFQWFVFCILYINNLHILSRQKTTSFANFENYSKSIFGNHLIVNSCQNVKFYDIIEIWKRLKNCVFFHKFFDKSHFKIRIMKIP